MPGILQKIEDATKLDRAAKAGTAAGSRLIPQGPVKDLLTGRWLGHPVHPLLTDTTIGFWSAALVLDLLGPRHARSAKTLTGLGIISAVPTAAAGLADWVDTIGAERRVGLVHAAGNVAAVAAYCGSFAARVRGDNRRGKVLSFAGATLLSAAGFLGGHLAYRIGSGVDRAAFQHPPEDWTPILAEPDLPANSPVVAQAGDVDVLMYRNSGRICAIANTCSHRGGPLNEGTIDAETRTVACPWHDSHFDLCTGEVKQGPASAPQPRFEARTNGGKIEVRVVK